MIGTSVGRLLLKNQRKSDWPPLSLVTLYLNLTGEKYWGPQVTIDCGHLLPPGLTWQPKKIGDRRSWGIVHLLPTSLLSNLAGEE